MVEAAKVCEAHLSEHGPSAPGLHLMGLIRAAAGSLAEAARFYRQALYLDPGHGDTLIHLALLLEKEGDVVAARRLRERALRRERGSTR